MSLTITSDRMPVERKRVPITQPSRRALRLDGWQRALCFSPLAWMKLLLFLHAGETEVGFFGICAADDLMYVEDLAVPRQTVSAVTVCFDDLSVADYFEDCADHDIQPSRCGRVWIHTHPGSSPMPSGVDEETFSRVFGSCDWSVMAIVARGGASYARLSFNAGPGGAAIIPIEVDWQRLSQDLVDKEGKLDELFSGWLDEYGRNVFPEERLSFLKEVPAGVSRSSPAYLDPRDEFDHLYDQMLLDEQIEGLYLDSMREGVYR